MTKGIADVNGVRITYETRGKGPPALLIMGVATAGWAWDKQVGDLARHFTVITYDHRGTGDSSPCGGAVHLRAGPARGEAPSTAGAASPGLTIADLAADAAGLLDHLGIARAHVVGISMGGFIAQTLALDHAARVDRLVLCSTSFGGPRAVSAPPQMLQDLRNLYRLSPEEMRERGLRLNFGERFIRERPADVRAWLKLREERPTPDETREAHLRACAAFDRSADVERITSPTLVVAGADDILIPPANARLLADAIPGAQLLLYEGAGHVLIVERAREFNRDLTGFLRGLEIPSLG